MTGQGYRRNWLPIGYPRRKDFGGPDRDRTGDLLNAIQDFRDYQQLTAIRSRGGGSTERGRKSGETDPYHLQPLSAKLTFGRTL